jgi:hypothetical protein
MTTYTPNQLRPYIAHYKGKKITFEAESSYAAQKHAAKIFRVNPNKAYTIAIWLADVEHSTSTI